MAITAINLARLNGGNGFHLDGERQVCTLELLVSNAGDANGDEFGDNHCVGYEVGLKMMYRVPVT